MSKTVFIESFLKKEPTQLTEQDIVEFITRKIEEGLNLDYKRIEVYDNLEKLSKSVSAFANSAGGLLIIGIEEESIKENDEIVRIFPGKITWGDKTLSKEKLEDNLLAKIHPRIDSLMIVPVRRIDGTVVFLIDVPQSDNPPHMAADNKYHKRLNFRTVPMEHYEIADLFGRRRKPRLSLILEFQIIDIKDAVYQFTVRFFIRNIGRAIARHTRLTVSFYNLEIIGTAHGDFQRINHIRQVPSIQFDEHISVFYPTPEFRTAIGEMTLKVIDINKPVLVVYDLIAEDMDLKRDRYEFHVDLLQKSKQMLEQGQKPFLSNE